MGRHCFPIPAECRAVSPIVVRTPDGLPFYACAADVVFTMPAGEYEMHGNWHYLGAMAPRPAPPLPDGMPPISLRWGRYPDKANVHTGTGLVRIDTRFRKAPEFVRTFVLMHELGHFLHRDEQGADAWAAAAMWHSGYNGSQIDAAARLSLTGCEGRKRENAHNVKKLENGQ